MSASKLTGALAIARSRNEEASSSTSTILIDSISDRVDGDESVPLLIVSETGDAVKAWFRIVLTGLLN